MYPEGHLKALETPVVHYNTPYVSILNSVCEIRDHPKPYDKLEEGKR
jgi:hypothetical protein